LAVVLEDDTVILVAQPEIAVGVGVVVVLIKWLQIQVQVGQERQGRQDKDTMVEPVILDLLAAAEVLAE
jgi:hypothetical protein